jgi:hypothetical protein
MTCVSKISKDILNSCDNVPVAGYEKKAWAMNREDVTLTLDATTTNLVTGIALASGEQAYTVTSVKKEMNGGFDLAAADNAPDTYPHYWSFQPYERDAESIKNFDDMSDIMIVVEAKGSKTEGCFIILGAETGLYKTSASQRANDNLGLPTYEFGSMEGQGERYSRFVFWDSVSGTYAGSKAILVALETP